MTAAVASPSLYVVSELSVYGRVAALGEDVQDRIDSTTEVTRAETGDDHSAKAS